MKLTSNQQAALSYAMGNKGIVSAGKGPRGVKLPFALTTLRSLERKGLLKFRFTGDHSTLSFISYDEHRFAITDEGRKVAEAHLQKILPKSLQAAQQS